MTPELRDLIIKLHQEKPSELGRGISPSLYAQANEEIIEQGKLLLMSEEILAKRGKDNTLFCGHFIYPYITEVEVE
jgi:hypothetical protein